ncbi:MAG: hypothetical protein QOJ62_1623 [Actinomycetota bacterium]|nr:hypothetical protein [Actinomycetota bacterium]
MEIGDKGMSRFGSRAAIILVTAGALSAGSLQIAALTSAGAAAAVPPTSWVPYPNSDSIELGDGSLDLVTSFASSAARVTSSTSPLSSATAVTAVTTNLTALLRASDGSTGALPPNVTTQPLLASPRVGLRPSTTVLEGTQAGLTLGLSETKPFQPSNAVGDTAAQISNGPFMYFVLSVTNTTGATSSPSSVYLGMDGACGAVMNNFPSAGSVAVPLCSSSDVGGTRYLVANTGSGVAAAVGTNLVSGFVSSGSVSGTGTSGSAALSLQVPALAAGASWSSTLVYGGWNTSAGVKAVNGSVMGFYYRQWWANAASMLSFAQQQATAALAATASSDADVTAIASDDASRYAAAHAFRGWRHAQWLVAQATAPLFYTIEGSFGYLSTLDVAYEYHALQTRYEPWKSKLELDELAAAYETDSAGNKYLQHDVGQFAQLTAGPAYDLKAGTRKHMAVEHNLDFVAMAMLWEKKTGLTYNHALLQGLLNAVEAHDTNSDGTFDVSSMTACRPDAVCRTSQLGTTYDGSITVAAGTEAGNTILGVKAGTIESIAAADGLTGPGGSSLATIAQRHFSAAQPFITQQNSNAALTGATKHPGYLSDGLWYAAMLGSNATIENNLSWLAQAIATNQTSDTTACPTCVTRVSNGDTTTWISKALDGDVVSSWLRATHPTLARPALELPKVSSVWVSRSGGFNAGTFEAITYPSENYLRADYYPRAASVWGVLWAGAGAPATGSISGVISDSASLGISGATVQACPTAGQACGVSATTASNGSYTLTVAPGSYYVWASAAGFQDTYLGGGHAPSDPQNTKATITSGSTSAVNLTLPAAGSGGGGTTVRINSGSTSAYTDAATNVWAADKLFSGGSTFTATSRAIAGTTDDTMYLSQRYGSFSYSIPEPAGSYKVTLKLAETWATAAGQRVFSVQAEGTTVLSNLDIFAEVGANSADDKTFTVPVSDGALTLTFVTGVQNPMVEGVEVIPVTASPGTVSGVISSTSGPAISGASVSVCPSAGVACGVTATTAGNGSYSVSVAPGTYYVWAHATGYTDTYSGGGHSASDPLNSTITVSSGGTTTVSLAMPATVVAPGTVSGVISSTSGPAISGATVSVCPTAGVACGVTATTASNGSYSVSVAPGTYYAWAHATGYTDTYSGGGHSASDPLNSTITVSSGATTTVSLAMPPVTTSFTPVFVNSGSTSAYTDAAGNIWASDRFFTGGKTFAATARTITGTSDSTLYLSQRYGAFSYSVAVPNGTYQVTLKFAETWATAAGQRVFSVQAEGATVLSNLDIFAEVGGNRVDDKVLTVAVSDGALNLSFITGVQNPMVEGISVQGAP